MNRSSFEAPAATLTLSLALGLLVLSCSTDLRADASTKVRINSGLVEGTSNADTGIRSFKGIPFAAPPVGELRWQPPKPATAWSGVRKAVAFGPRCMQGAIYSDMIFRDSGPNEDCLTLNVWTPTQKAGAKLPVMVWIFGGGFQAGAPSEPRQDGENLAKKGVLVVTLNYRLGLFGFLAHPDLTKESPHHASGNYGLMDQTAAIAWVKKNIASFGGDPDNLTIFGESAGSISVSAQMASPLAKGLFQKAIGESGAVFPLSAPTPTLEKSEEAGLAFAKSLGSPTLKDLRAKSADSLLQAAVAYKEYRFRENVDGFFFPRDPVAIYAAGDQAHVPLLAGWNADEQNAASLFREDAMTKENYESKIRAAFGDKADEILKLYPDDSEEQLQASARDLQSDRFIAYSTWKWIDEQSLTGARPVYRYHFEQVPPVPAGEKSRGAYHSADIKYVFETLNSEKLAWTVDDRSTSDLISSYWTNFAKKSDPNGPGLPDWQRYDPATHYAVMHIGASSGSSQASKSEPDRLRARYQLLNQFADEKSNPHPASASTGR